MSEAKEYDYIQQWKNILDVDTLKGNVNLISMFITVYELLEDTIISRPKDFYTIIEFDEIAKRKYEEHVLPLYDKNAFPDINTRNKELISSLIWLKNGEAIDDNDIHILSVSRVLRNKVTHEMLASIAEGAEQLVNQFALMYGLFCKIEKWWISEIEIPIGGEFSNLSEEERQGVMSGNMILLEIIFDILANDSNIKFKEACEEIGIPVK